MSQNARLLWSALGFHNPYLIYEITKSFRHPVGELGRGMGSLQDLSLHRRGQTRSDTFMHQEGLGTHYLSFRDFEGSKSLGSRCHYDWPFLQTQPSLIL
jgi:hypothetical protein